MTTVVPGIGVVTTAAAGGPGGRACANIVDDGPPDRVISGAAAAEACASAGMLNASAVTPARRSVCFTGKLHG
jgi:hypothetical protein